MTEQGGIRTDTCAKVEEALSRPIAGQPAVIDGRLNGSNRRKSRRQACIWLKKSSRQLRSAIAILTLAAAASWSNQSARLSGRSGRAPQATATGTVDLLPEPDLGSVTG